MKKISYIIILTLVLATALKAQTDSIFSKPYISVNVLYPVFGYFDVEYGQPVSDNYEFFISTRINWGDDISTSQKGIDAFDYRLDIYSLGVFAGINRYLGKRFYIGLGLMYENEVKNESINRYGSHSFGLAPQIGAKWKLRNRFILTTSCAMGYGFDQPYKNRPIKDKIWGFTFGRLNIGIAYTLNRKLSLKKKG